ncbi:MAG: hypothetical protein M3Z02_10970 [Actinomycetota bacterium]|nr:hypothetical protein [Actinomycetota bacterium]
MSEGDPQVLTSMLATAPPLPRKVMPFLAPRVYRRYAHTVHGAPTP